MAEIKELQSLTTPKGVYNSFPDKTAREQLGGKLNAPDSVKAGDYLRVQSIGADGTVVLEGAEGTGDGSGQNVELDATLTKSGKAADAAAAGKRLTAVETALSTGGAQSRLKGKLIGIIGDSISSLTRGPIPYYTYISERNGGIEYSIRGISGGKLVSYAAEDISADCGMVFVMGGTNDFNGSQPLGQVGDTTRDTFCGGIYALISDIRARSPQATILFATPIGASRAWSASESQNYADHPEMGGVKMIEFVDKMIEVCGYLHVPCLDMFRLSGLDPTNTLEYEADGLHPNSHGQEKMSYVIEEFWKRYYVAPPTEGGGSAVTLPGITAEFDDSASVTVDNSMADLRQHLTVTAIYSVGTSEVVTSYTLSGALDEVGTTTITVIYAGKRTTFDVAVGPSGASQTVTVKVTVEGKTEQDFGASHPIKFKIAQDGTVSSGYVGWMNMRVSTVFDVSGAAAITPDAVERPDRLDKTSQYTAEPHILVSAHFYDYNMELVGYAICDNISYMYGEGDNRDQNYAEVLNSSTINELNGIPVVRYTYTEKYDPMHIKAPVIPVPANASFAQFNTYAGDNNGATIPVGSELNVIISY